jgi:probable HAF family extracellular repeat protein
MSRAHTLVPLVPLSLFIGCADQPVPTAPSVSTPNLATYTVTVAAPAILGGISGSSFDIAVGINTAGDIAGVSGNFPNGHAVRWAAGSTTPVPVDAADARANDINSFGQLVGEKNLRASLWTPNGVGGYTLTDIGAQLPVANYSNAWGINSHGQVVGVYRPFATTGPFSDVCFLWTPTSANATTGTVTTFAGLGGTFCVANDINSSGHIAGASTTSGGAQHAFLWSPTSANAITGSIQNLAPTAFASYGAAINDALQIAGQHTGATGVGIAAIWTPTGGGGFTVTELGTFGGVESHAMDMNDAGFVVGWVRNPSFLDNAFFWQSGAFTELPPGPYDITSTTALTNLAGNLVRVVGASTNSTTGARAALRWDVTVSDVTAHGCLAQLIQLVEQMRADGKLSAGEAKSLLAKLDAAVRQLDAGKIAPTRNLLHAFTNEVNALESSGRLSSTDAQPLIDGANCVLASL